MSKNDTKNTKDELRSETSAMFAVFEGIMGKQAMVPKVDITKEDTLSSETGANIAAGVGLSRSIFGSEIQ